MEYLGTIGWLVEITIKFDDLHRNQTRRWNIQASILWGQLSNHYLFLSSLFLHPSLSVFLSHFLSINIYRTNKSHTIIWTTAKCSWNHWPVNQITIAIISEASEYFICIDAIWYLVECQRWISLLFYLFFIIDINMYIVLYTMYVYIQNENCKSKRIFRSHNNNNTSVQMLIGSLKNRLNPNQKYDLVSLWWEWQYNLISLQMNEQQQTKKKLKMNSSRKLNLKRYFHFTWIGLALFRKLVENAIEKVEKVEKNWDAIDWFNCGWFFLYDL